MKLGPWASMDTWASVRGAPDRFFTHFDCTVVVVVVAVVTGGVVGGEDTTSDVEAVLHAIHV